MHSTLNKNRCTEGAGGIGVLRFPAGRQTDKQQERSNGSWSCLENMYAMHSKFALSASICGI